MFSGFFFAATVSKPNTRRSNARTPLLNRHKTNSISATQRH